MQKEDFIKWRDCAGGQYYKGRDDAVGHYKKGGWCRRKV